ncbi:MAG TPA: hypothetical protein VFY64_11590 [Nitrososphaeraceae archaeon]|nr:hypothetical protein [Nitrososphaeraceae archaeon]
MIPILSATTINNNNNIEYLSTAGQVAGGVSASSVNKNLTIDERTGNMNDITSGGVSAASVGNGNITSERIGNTSGPIFGGLSLESVGK